MHIPYPPGGTPIKWIIIMEQRLGVKVEFHIRNPSMKFWALGRRSPQSCHTERWWGLRLQEFYRTGEDIPPFKGAHNVSCLGPRGRSNNLIANTKGQTYLPVLEGFPQRQGLLLFTVEIKILTVDVLRITRWLGPPGGLFSQQRSSAIQQPWLQLLKYFRPNNKRGGTQTQSSAVSLLPASLWYTATLNGPLNTVLPTRGIRPSFIMMIRNQSLPWGSLQKPITESKLTY